MAGQSDEFSRLSGTLRGVSTILDGDLSRRWVDGAQAHAETRYEPLAGLSKRPAADAVLHAQLLVTAANDHIKALAELIDADSVIFSISTVGRGALEALGQAAHVGDPRIDARERVRRHTNLRLIDLHEQRRLLEGISARNDDGPRGLEEVRDRSAAIIREARRLHFKLCDVGDKFRPPQLVPKTPGKSKMCADAIDSTVPGLGETVYRALSSVAHAQSFGLRSGLITDWVDLDPVDGVTHAKVGISARDLALRLCAVPLALHAVVLDLYALMGWRHEGVKVASQLALQTWGSMAGVFEAS